MARKLVPGSFGFVVASLVKYIENSLSFDIFKLLVQCHRG